MNRYAFINADGIVVQVIVGDLNAQQQAQFLGDYSVIFGATQIFAVDADTAVWIGGSYTDGTFTAPPEPEVITTPTEPEVPSDPLPS